MALRRNPRRTRRATEAERRRAQDAGQTIPTYVYLDGSPAPDSGCGDGSSAYDSGSSSSSSYDSGGSSGYSSHDSGSSYSSGSYDSGSSSCDSGGGGF